MYNKARDDLFDAILTTAFTEYWNRELEKMPSDEELKKMYPVPKKGLRLAKKLEKRRKYGKSPALVYLQRASVIVLVVIAAVFALLTTSPTIRAAIGNSFTAWFNDHVVIDFTEDPVAPVSEKSTDTTADSETEADPATVESLKIGYIPDGFELVSEEEREGTRRYIYMAEDGRYISITISSADMSKVSIDNELNDYDEIVINNKKAYILYNEIESIGTLVFGNNNCVVTINGLMTEEILIDIATNIK